MLMHNPKVSNHHKITCLCKVEVDAEVEAEAGAEYQANGNGDGAIFRAVCDPVDVSQKRQISDCVLMSTSLDAMVSSVIAVATSLIAMLGAEKPVFL